MGRPFKERTRFTGKDGFWYYDCVGCEQWYPEHKMSKNASYKFGIDKYCRVCRQESRERVDRRNLPEKVYRPDGTVKERWVVSTNRTFGTRFMGYSDYEDTMNFFKHIGYDIEKDIHQQFCERMKEKHGVVLEQTDVKHTDVDPYPFKSPYKKDNQ